MPLRNTLPKYRRHKQSGQAIVTLTDGFGGRRDVLLGQYGTAASKAEYNRVVAEWVAGGRQLPGREADRRAGNLSVNELALAFLNYADDHYRRPDGTPTKEPFDYRMAFRPLCYLYGLKPVGEFGPLALKAVRELMVNGYVHPKYGQQRGLSRGVVNQAVGRIRRAFKWGVENELVPATVLQALQAVRGLQRGRSPARETEPVRPVAEAVVEATLPFLPSPLAAAVKVQLLTGARPGEVLAMRAIDLDTTGAVWLFTPGSDRGKEGQHKTAHHGYRRVIAVGPKAQEVLREFLQPDLTAPLFSPRRFMEERRERRRVERKSKVQPSQVDRRKRNPKRRPGDAYSVTAYAKAIRRACTEAFPPPGDLARKEDETHQEWQARLTEEQQAQLREWRKAHHWHPHQLRHTAATKLRREFGLDVARVVLGHRTPTITEMYAEIDVTRAAEAMARIG